MERVIVKDDRFFAVSDADGSMRADGPDGHGLWWGDTRFLSDYHLLIDGHEPEPVDVQVQAGWVTLELAAGALRVRRERYVDAGMHERITITNPGPSRSVADVVLVCGADFAAMLAVRRIVPVPAPPPAARAETVRGIELRDSSRVTEVIVRPPGNHHRPELGPGEEFVLEVDVLTGSGQEHATFEAGLGRIRGAYKQWADDCVTFETDNPALNELLRQSRDDMRMLCDQYPTGIYPTGGLPWFAVPFGRDALFTSMFALPMNPQIARGTLRYLAARQGKLVDRDTEEQPGKILHEVRTGDLVDRGLWPGILYGTVDATPLFLCALAATLDWTADTELFDELWPAAEAALEWCVTYGDVDHDGYVEYSGGRARNQGWKDSDDALTHVDGTPAPLPAAICEVQGYLYQGLLAMARKRPELKAAAADLRRKFNRDFWMARERFVAQGLDGGKRQVEALTSNPGHCLWTGILPPKQSGLDSFRRNSLRVGGFERSRAAPSITTPAAITTVRYGRTIAPSPRRASGVTGWLERRPCWHSRSSRRAWPSRNGACRSSGAARTGRRAQCPTTIGTVAAPRTGRRRPRSPWSPPCWGSKQTRRAAACASLRSRLRCGDGSR
jgi:glycogen debranching enzyme